MQNVDCWDSLEYWRSQDWQTVQEKLDELDQAGIPYNPDRHNLFAALDAVPFNDVRVVIVGQDPYPSHLFATGTAFSLPRDVGIHKFQFPPTLNNIFDEYVRDLGYPFPTTGCLDKWVRQGVLLWNAIPSCLTGKSLSHDWPEWKSLTEEIITLLGKKHCIFVFMGRVAREFSKFTLPDNIVLETPHPSPRAKTKYSSVRNKTSYSTFEGSRIFSTINSHLVEPIDWRLT